MEEQPEETTTSTASSLTIPWSSLPVAPPGFVWARKDRFAQTRTRNYYPVPEVVSALEKSLFSGNFEEASFWFYEYVTLGPQFVTSTWAFMFHFVASSVSVANPHLLPHLWSEHGKYKSFLSLDATVDEELDSRCLTIMLQALRVLCESPKSRIVDSAIRTFLLPFPDSAYVRPYEPHRSHAHVRHVNGGNDDASSTSVPCSSYADTFDDDAAISVDAPRYSLFALEEDDPPYLYGWCNAMVQSIDTFITTRDNVDEAMSAVLYYAGLIYQCTEPCHTRVRRQDSIMILWQIVGKYKARLSDESSRLVNSYRLAGDEFSKNSHKRERYFVVGALLTLLNELHGETAMEALVAPDVDIRTLAHLPRLPVPDAALDYTTKQGVALGATVTDYVRQSSVMCESNDVYWELAVLYERLRAEEQFKDPKRKLMAMVPFLRFAVRVEQQLNADVEVVRKPKTAPKTAVKLTDIYTVPRWLYEEESTTALPWRGQFVPWCPDSKFASCRAAPISILTEVTCLGSQFGNAGLFYGVFAMTKFESERVVFVPCATNQQAFSQCIVDELKPLFGVPPLGTHCFYLDASLRKKNKKDDWSDDNMEWDTETGSFYVCYRASSFGFTSFAPDDMRRHMDSTTASVLVTETHANQGGNLGKQLLVSSAANEALRNQLTNIFIFYACVGAPGVSPSRILVRPIDGRPLDKTKVLDGDVDELAALATARLVPFYELAAFANVRFPTTFKPLKSVLTKKLLLDDQDHFMRRYLDVLQHLEYSNLELVLQTFCTPFVEWASCVRDNLRDLRSAWLLWSKHVDASHMEQMRKRTERNRTRLLEKKKAREEDDDTKKKKESGGVKRANPDATPVVAKKKLPPPPPGKKVKLLMEVTMK